MNELHTNRARLGYRHGWRCRYCLEPVTYETSHIEHVIPQSSVRRWPHGEYIWSDANVVLACVPCNLSKGAKDPVEWWLLMSQRTRGDHPGLASLLVEMAGDVGLPLFNPRTEDPPRWLAYEWVIHHRDAWCFGEPLDDEEFYDSCG